MFLSIRRLLASAVLASSFLAATSSAQNSTPRLTTEQWREDLHVLAEQMPLKHLKLFHTMTPAEFHAAIAKLDADLPQLNDDQILVRFMQLGVLIQDGHSGLEAHPMNSTAADRIPVRFDRYADGIYITAAAPEYAEAVGGKVLKIGATDWREAIARVDTVIPHDPGNDGPRITRSGKMYLNWPRVLHGLDLIASADDADFVIEKNGQAHTFHFKPSIPLGEVHANTLPAGWIDARPTSIAASLARQHEDQAYWFTPIPTQHAIYFQFNAVQNMPGENIATFAHKFASAINQPDIDRVVIDVRNNGGGDNTQLRPLLVAIIASHLNHRGGIFVLTSPTTFSAAENFCNRLSNYTDAIFIGRPTGENVNMYGDAVPITLPNSHLRMNVSTLFWQDMDPRDKRTAMFPEIAVEPTFADYIAGKDPTLDLALNTRTPTSIDDQLTAALPGGVDAVFARYKQFIDDPTHRYFSNPEARLNNLGYTLMSSNRVPDAIVIFQVNVKAFPNSANTYDSLGEAYLKAGKKQEGLSAYKKAVELNPTNENAKQILQQSTTPQ